MILSRVIIEHPKTDFSLSETYIDNALHFKQERNEPIVLIGQYVDDSFQAGNNEFFKNTDDNLKKIKSRDREHEKTVSHKYM